jgi:predicted enzyme related to lactoylglutathione lyase
MKLKYLPVYTADFEGQIDFYTQKLGFRVTGKMTFYEGRESTVIQSDKLNVALLVTNNDSNSDKSNIIINTADCLNDYHLLRTAGVFFCKSPAYLPAGLAAEFLDPAGNKFMLLEERNYNEQ